MWGEGGWLKSTFKDQTQRAQNQPVKIKRSKFSSLNVVILLSSLSHLSARLYRSKDLGISVPVNLCFNQSSFLLYWQKVRFYIRFFPVNKDCNRDMARFPPVFDTNPPATACSKPKLQEFEGKVAAKSFHKAWRLPTLNSHHWVKLCPNQNIYVPIR